MTTRATTPGGQLARLGFADPARAERLLQDPVLTGFADPLDDLFHDGLPDALSAAADPDQALLGLVRLIESLRDRGTRPRAGRLPNGRPLPDRTTKVLALLVALRRPGPARDRLVAVLGGSIALVDHLVGHPEHWRCVADAVPPTAEGLRAGLVAAVAPAARGEHRPTTPSASPTGASCWPSRPSTSPHRTRSRTCPRSPSSWPGSRRRPSTRRSPSRGRTTAPGTRCARLAIIGMGKTGGGELNYVSDVDVIFVGEPARGATEDEAMSVGNAPRSPLMRACSATRRRARCGPSTRPPARGQERAARAADREPPRPTTSAGPRRGSSRPCSRRGCPPATWRSVAPTSTRSAPSSGRRPGATTSSTTCARCVGGSRRTCRSAEAARQLKLGRGGPARRRVRGAAAPARARAQRPGAAVGDDPRGARLAGQGGLRRARRRGDPRRGVPAAAHPRAPDPAAPPAAHPPHADERQRPATPRSRSIGLRVDSARGVVDLWQSRAREVRRIHERLFYRPLLNAAAQLTTVDTTLSAEAGARTPAGPGVPRSGRSHAPPRGPHRPGSRGGRRSSARCCR